MHNPVEAAAEAARRGGAILREHMGRVAPREKGPADLVTDADLASQDAIQQLLTSRFPNYAFLGEESSEQERSEALASGKPLWVVDPLDGTANFVHSLPSFSVSIALIESGQPVVGVVYDPLLDTLYLAAQDPTSRRLRVSKNGKAISVSDCAELKRAMVCCSFRPGVKREDPEVGQFLNILERSQSVRRLGSAALNLCYVAEGCLDAYWANSVKTWDVAAGYLIAKAAGAQFAATDGSDFDLWNPKLVVASSEVLKQSMLECLNAPPV